MSPVAEHIPGQRTLDMKAPVNVVRDTSRQYMHLGVHLGAVELMTMPHKTASLVLRKQQHTSSEHSVPVAVVPLCVP